jgi:hypothetical protein
MSWRNLTIATAFLVIIGMANAQDVPGVSAGGTSGGGVEQRNPPAPALGGSNSAEGISGSSAPLGGIARRDVPGAQPSVLRYTISAYQSFETGAVPSGSGTPESSGVAGTLAYTSSSARNQFGTTYSGGGGWSSQATSSNTNFQNLELRDTLKLRRFTIMVLNDLSYSPQSPIGGSSGIPGVGDLSGNLGFGTVSPTILPDQTIFSLNSQRVSNATAGSVTLNLTGRTTITAMGSYGVLQFLDTDGYNSHQEMAGLTLDHRFSARDTAGVKYTFTGFGYNDMPTTINTNQVSLIYERLWSRRWKTDFEIGPQWAETTETSSLPTHVYVSGSASVTYNLARVTSLDLRYIRGVSGGSGVVMGSRVDSVSLAATRSFGHYWSGSITGAYSRNVALFQDQLFTSKSAGAQLTRKFGRDFSGYFSYMAIDQSSSGAPFVAPVNVLQGLYNVFSFGIQFTSRPVRVRGV